MFYLRNLSIILILLTVFSSPLTAQDDFDQLIKEVIQKAQDSYDTIDMVSFKAHSKVYIYFGFSPLDVNLIPFYEEYYLDGLWMKPDSIRLNVNAVRVVTADDEDSGSLKRELESNLPLPNPFMFNYDPSIFTTKKKTGNNDGFLWPIYPFAKGAEELYNYEFVSEVTSNLNSVVEVRVEPKTEDTPGVLGIFQIDKHRKEVVGFDYIFNSASGVKKPDVHADRKSLSISVNFTDNYHVKSTKALYYQVYWLPEEQEEEFEVEIWGIKAKIHRVLEFESYDVNPVEPPIDKIPDQKISYNIDTEVEDSLFAHLPYPNRLSRAEEERIIKRIEDRFKAKTLFKELIDSENIAKEAALQGLEDKKERYINIANSIGGFFQYNRVEGSKLNYGKNFSDIGLKNSVISGKLSYGFIDERFKEEFAYLLYPDRKKKYSLELGLYNTIGFEEDNNRVKTGKNTVTSLFLKRDYRDYYYKKGGTLSLGVRLTDSFAVKFTGISQTEEPTEEFAKFSVFNHGESFRINPGIIRGELRGLKAALFYRTHYLDMSITGEYTDKSNFHSDFSYSRISGDLVANYRTTYHSNLKWSTFWGFSDGYLPPQKWFDFGGKIIVDHVGKLRGVGYKAFTGDRMARSILELELDGDAVYYSGFGDDGIKLFKFTLWGGAGWSDLAQRNMNYAGNIITPRRVTDDVYFEYGLGMSDKINLFRMDVIRNSISGNRLYVTINFLR
ncbi:DUF5686 family protein [candidate division KSB1 bacterium]